jgi:HlyD family type I secretion membrane fusion protein
MRPDIDPQKILRRLPPEWIKRYRRYMGDDTPSGALDDVRGPIKVGLIVLALFFGGFLLWAAFMPMSGAAVAPGVVTVAGDRQGVQTLNGGVVDRMMVKEGDRVAAGQVLLRLNGVAGGARLSQSQSQSDVLKAAEARLIAQRDGLDAIPFPQDLLQRRGELVVGQALANQQALFDSRKRVIDAERAIAQARVTQASAQVTGSNRQLALINEELAGMRSLYRRGYAPKSTLVALERTAVDLQTRGVTGDSEVLQARLAAAREDEARTAETIEQLRQVQTQLSQVSPQLDVSRYGAERDLVRAPFSGKVVGVARLGPGSVISPGSKITDLLPEGRAFIVEAKVRPQDVDDVTVGGEAHVRFTTVNPRGRSNVVGKVTTLSADRLTDKDGQPYYLAYIALDAEELRRDKLDLQAGLPATVNIKTANRTFLNYLLAPLGDAMSHAGREE